MATIKPGLAAEPMLFDALDALKRGDVRPWVDMFDDDGVMEFPYAPPGFPSRLDGKAAIAEYMRTYPDHLSIERVIPRAVYHCDDVMVVEFACESRVVTNGARFEMNYIGVVKTEDGKVKHYRDYWNPLVALQAMGAHEALLAFGSKEQKT
jgi:uncharacterized protein